MNEAAKKKTSKLNAKGQRRARKRAHDRSSKQQGVRKSVGRKWLDKRLPLTVEAHQTAKEKYKNQPQKQKVRYFQANNILKRHAYQIGRKVEKEGWLDDLKGYIAHRVKELDMDKSGMESRDSNIFTWVFRAIRLASMETAKSGGVMTKQNSSKYAAELAYAHRHQVPPQLLPGFLYQCGAYETIKEKCDDQEYKEPWWEPGKWDIKDMEAE